MKTTTDSSSFALQSCQFGLGVHATHGIAKGTWLGLFGKATQGHEGRQILGFDAVPERFRKFCIHLGDGLVSCPEDLENIPVGWYLNHSTTPNAFHDDEFNYFALADIQAGEEITIDYVLLGEPEACHEPYYKRNPACSSRPQA